MSIGTQTDLLAAAFGKKTRDTTTPPTRMVPVQPASAPRTNSMMNLATKPYRELAAAANLNEPANEGPISSYLGSDRFATPTNTFANILATGGYRGSGKYSGFNTASDLETAVIGSAYDLMDYYVPQLRASAAQYRGDVESAKTDAYRQAMNQVMAGVTGRIPALPMGVTEVPEGSVYATKINPLRGYKQQLQDWGATAETMAPAQEYLTTAQQIESTPMAELARSIAIQRYGMDPMLARGKFANIGQDYWQKERDEEYMARYGMPYEEYKFQQDQLMNEQRGYTKEQQEQAESYIESLTGLRTSTLSELTAQSPLQLYDVLSSGQYEIPDPETGETGVFTGAGVINAVRNSISSGDVDNLRVILESVQATPDGEGMALLVAALMRQYLVQPEKTLESLEDIGLFDQ